MDRINPDARNFLKVFQEKAEAINAAKQIKSSPEYLEMLREHMHNAAVFLCSTMVEEAFNETLPIFERIKGKLHGEKPPIETFEQIFRIMKDEICAWLELPEQIVKRIIEFAKDKKSEPEPETIDVSPPICKFARVRIGQLSLPQQ